MKVFQTLVISLGLIGTVAAQDIRLNGTLSHTIKTNHNSREIKLLKIQLSDKAKKSLTNNTHYALTHTHQFALNTHAGKFPSSIQLGMNDVPVLDQGSHGSCVTFAVTAAYDAIIGSDQISQLCQLQLGNYLEANGYGYSGWEGSLGRFVLSQIDSFGIVTKAQEASHGCGGLYQYPTDEPTPTSSITLRKYHKISEPLPQLQAVWSPILDLYQALDRLDTNKTLDEVKSSLVHGDRVVFATLLLDFDLGFMGAAGKKSNNYDSWVLTPEIARDIYLNPEFGGHEMVITGYDDQATATDDEGRIHQGLLTLRNSWGDSVGNKGDFYMSYDYFKLLVIEAQRIRHKGLFD